MYNLLMEKNYTRRIKALAEELFDLKIQNLYEETGEQGRSGAAVHYFHFDLGTGVKKFVVKHATQLERQVLSLLQEQGCAVPKLLCDPSTLGRDWVVMEFTDEIPSGANETDQWAKKLAKALAGIHASNVDSRPNWLPGMNNSEPLADVFAVEWEAQYEELLNTNPKFRKLFGSLQQSLQRSYEEFKLAVKKELEDGHTSTLISTDLTPSHWRQAGGSPILIDWEQARFGTLYLDLPNMFNHKTIKHYYRELANAGVDISEDEFKSRFSLLSRYLGFRYMTVGFSYWKGKPDRDDEYWKLSGESFFTKCLDIAQNGYPKPKL